MKNSTGINIDHLMAFSLFIVGVLILLSYPFLADESSEIGVGSYAIGTLLCFIFSAVFYIKTGK